MPLYTVKTEQELVSAIPFPIAVTVLDEVDSTNTYALKNHPGTGPDWALVLAEKQSAGKGRMQRSFFSPSGSGIYMSLCFHPDLSIPLLRQLPAMACCSVLYAVREVCGIQTAVKWVNDLYLNGKKVCGILVQTQNLPNRPPLTVIGIGINFTDPAGGYPPDLREKAGSLFSDKTPPVTREALIVSVVTHLYSLYAKLPDTSYLADYRRYCFLLGRKILVRRLVTGEEIPATAEGIDESGALQVLYPDGKREILDHGEVSILETA